MGAAAVIAAIFSFLTLVLKMVQQTAPARKEKKATDNANENIQIFRNELQKGDAGGINARLSEQHDRVRQALASRGRNGNGDGQQTGAEPMLSGQGTLFECTRIVRSE